MERDQATKLMQGLLRKMVDKNGSDLFITAGFPPAIRNLIREAKVAQMNAAIQTGASLGMQTLDQCLTDLVRKNVISMSEARHAAQVKENFPG